MCQPSHRVVPLTGNSPQTLLEPHSAAAQTPCWAPSPWTNSLCMYSVPQPVTRHPLCKQEKRSQAVLASASLSFFLHVFDTDDGEDSRMEMSLISSSNGREQQHRMDICYYCTLTECVGSCISLPKAKSCDWFCSMFLPIPNPVQSSSLPKNEASKLHQPKLISQSTEGIHKLASSH